MEKKKTWNVYIPSAVNVQFIIPKGKRVDAAKALIDGAHYILSLLIPDVQDHKKMKQFTINGYLHLNTEYLQRIVGTRYKRIITLLEQHGLIEVNHHFKQGEFSMSYRISSKYLSASKAVEITNPTMKRKYFEFEAQQKAKQVRRLKKTDR